MEEIHSIYLHIPFCQKRCSYCDFNTFSGVNHLLPTYISQLRKEIAYYGEKFLDKPSLKTIFFGGGTPSLISIDQYEGLFTEIKKYFNIDPKAEVSLEANPGTVSFGYLSNLSQIGFNRISFGLQTSNPHQLQLLGRIHSHFDSIQAIKWAKQAGFENINLDLIYGLPGQTLKDWEKNIKDCLGLGTQHFSFYALGIEEDTPIFNWVNKGLVSNPYPDLAAEMYELADDLLLRNGFDCYEISNYSKRDEIQDWRCQHNLQYWRNGFYLGLGAGAHGYVGNIRYANVGGIGDYIKRMGEIKGSGKWISPVVTDQNKIDKYTEMQETMMLGLRLVEEGVSNQDFIYKFDISPLEIFMNELSYLEKNGLVQIIDGNKIVLTKKARLLGNIVFQQFVN